MNYSRIVMISTLILPIYSFAAQTQTTSPVPRHQQSCLQRCKEVWKENPLLRLIGYGLASCVAIDIATQGQFKCTTPPGTDMTGQCFATVTPGNLWISEYSQTYCPLNRSITAYGIELSPEIQALGKITCIQRKPCTYIMGVTFPDQRVVHGTCKPTTTRALINPRV